MPLPVIAIVGRPNVGKSSLFNWLAGRRISIVDPTAGVTRDRVSSIVPIQDRFVELTDTGGIGIEDMDKLTADVERQIQNAIEEADLVLFVVDGRDGLVPLDEVVAERLRSLNKPVLLVVNKCDATSFDLAANDFYRLGYEPVLPVSAEQQRGQYDLYEAILKRLPPADDENPPEEVELELAIVGRRNVGKSTFINALAEEERVIVSEVAGTTRDSVDVRFERDGKVFIAIDTAGVRNKSSLANSIEFYSLARAERSIRRADVVLHFFDASVPISRIDKQLTDYILKHNKPAIFVMNKWDLVKQQDVSTEEFGEYVAKTFPMLDYVPIVFITAKTGKNVHKLLNLAQHLVKQAKQRVTTGELNRVLEHAMDLQPPPARMGRLPKVYYATQVAVEPPTIILFVNNPILFDETYRRYLIKHFRDQLPFPEVPIKLEFRSRHSGKGETKSKDDKLDIEMLPDKIAVEEPKPTPKRKKKDSPELWNI